MKKNKRILLAIITILVSTMLFTNRTEARTIMLLNCRYVEQCTSEACNTLVLLGIRVTKEILIGVEYMLPVNTIRHLI